MAVHSSTKMIKHGSNAEILVTRSQTTNLARVLSVYTKQNLTLFYSYLYVDTGKFIVEITNIIIVITTFQ